jgi:Integrase core domain/GAG-pre-integrase domain
MRSTADELSFIGAPISDEELMRYILEGLGTDFNYVVVTVNTRFEPFSFTELMSLILSHESLIQSQLSSLSNSITNPTGFYSNPKNISYLTVTNAQSTPRFNYPRPRSTRPPPIFNPPQNFGPPLLPNPQNRPPSFQWAPFTPNASNSLGLCQICQKRGHSADRCYHRYDSRYGTQPAPPPPRMSPFQAHVALPTPPSPTSPWVIDSGATHHFTSDINNLSTYVPYNGTAALHIGDGSALPIQHIGSCSLSFSNFTLELCDILHVPSFTTNLLSLSKLLSDNYLLIEFSSQFCVVKDHLTKIVLLQAPLLNGLYTIPHPTPPLALLGVTASADLWHQRLGHPSQQTTIHVLHSNSLSCSSKTLSFCNNCSMAKSHKLPFNSSSSTASQPLELIHSDLWGPAPVLSKFGFHYYVLFIDDYSRFTWIYFLHSKDELTHVFKIFKAQVENLLNTTIKTLRTDGGTEYKPLARLFPELTHQITCPYTPQ